MHFYGFLISSHLAFRLYDRYYHFYIMHFFPHYNLFTWVSHENELDIIHPPSSALWTSIDIRNFYMTHASKFKGVQAVEVIRAFLGYLEFCM